MTYGCLQSNCDNRAFVAVCHSAELVRGDFLAEIKAPSSGPSDHLLPKGRRAAPRGSKTTHAQFLSVSMRAAVVRLQQVAAEHALRIDPHRMHVVGAVLGVVVLDQRGRAVHAEIVRTARRLAAGPGEVQRLDAGLAHLGKLAAAISSRMVPA